MWHAGGFCQASQKLVADTSFHHRRPARLSNQSRGENAEKKVKDGGLADLAIFWSKFPSSNDLAIFSSKFPSSKYYNTPDETNTAPFQLWTLAEQ